MTELLSLYADYRAINASISLLAWDRQVLMPPGGAEARSIHIERLAGMEHRHITGEPMRRALEKAEKEAAPGSDEAALCARLKRDIDTETKLPEELVMRRARVSSDAYENWKQAKAENDFARLRPYYEQLFEIAVETAGLLGYQDHPYDALLDQYEEGSTCADAQAMFEAIKPEIVGLVQEISERGTPVDDRALYGDWSADVLRDFSQETAALVGFDFEKGRLNVAPNAFCTTIAYGDVRLTTRASDHIKGVVSSSLHEMGHGLYEQGSPQKWAGTPLEGGISLAVHESQSRLWENIVGRSLSFWRFFLPRLQAHLPQLRSVSLDAFHHGINVVQAEPIRVGADELTYNLHILVRFELEVEIVTGKLKVKDLPEAWNEKYRAYLGLVPEGDGVGCLQDVHWSRGMVGYFPTYSIGNLIGAQVWEKLCSEVGDTDAFMERGEFGPILGWLQERIYSQARRYEPKELVRRVTGDEMRPDAWLRYARSKYRGLYGLD